MFSKTFDDCKAVYADAMTSVLAEKGLSQEDIEIKLMDYDADLAMYAENSMQLSGGIDTDNPIQMHFVKASCRMCDQVDEALEKVKPEVIEAMGYIAVGYQTH